MASPRRPLCVGDAATHAGTHAHVLLTLALGVGATTAVFTVVHAVLLEPLPYPDSAQLVRLWEEHPGGQSPAGNRWLSLRTRLAWRDRSLTIEDAGAYGSYDYLVRQPGFEPSRLHGATLSPSVFRLLRVTPAIGRFFVEGEDAAGAVIFSACPACPHPRSVQGARTPAAPPV